MANKESSEAAKKIAKAEKDKTANKPKKNKKNPHTLWCGDLCFSLIPRNGGRRCSARRSSCPAGSFQRRGARNSGQR